MKKCVYTVYDVAEILQVSAKTVYRIIQAGDIRVIWVRGQIRITEEALNAYLQGGGT